MAEWRRQYGVAVWACCLMPNHVHLIAVPNEEGSLHLAIGEAHRRYTRMINFREGWRGHLWKGRFSSYVMDERYLLACARYIENNPVRAKLSDRAEGWRWSSAAAHLWGRDDGLVTVKPMLRLVNKTWAEFLSALRFFWIVRLSPKNPVESRDLCKTPTFAQSLCQTQILILKILIYSCG